VTKQSTKWPYVGNAVFRIVQNHGEQSYFLRFLVGSPQSPSWIRPWLLESSSI